MPILLQAQSSALASLGFDCVSYFFSFTTLSCNFPWTTVWELGTHPLANIICSDLNLDICQRAEGHVNKFLDSSWAWLPMPVLGKDGIFVE